MTKIKPNPTKTLDKSATAWYNTLTKKET
jgi:hypothetical protein